MLYKMRYTLRIVALLGVRDVFHVHFDIIKHLAAFCPHFEKKDEKQPFPTKLESKCV